MPEGAMVEPGAPTMSPLTLARHRHAILLETLADRAEPLARSNRFTVWSLGDADGVGNASEDVVVVHDFRPDEIDNNIGGYVADELMPLLTRLPQRALSGYAYNEQEIFERYVGAIVRSVDGNERRAWHRFYDNTLSALRRPLASTLDRGVADFNACARAFYARVAELAHEVAAASLLDVATCFGFLPLYLADENGPLRRIVGCDLNPALVALAEDYRPARDIRSVAFVQADILAADVRRDLAVDRGGFDVVTAIHLLEHLTAADCATAVANLWALTGRRLIIAVPFEAVADPRFGHRQVFDETSLKALGRSIGGHCQYSEHHGGWLIVDRDPTNEQSREEHA
jgi:Methylase involved in ubiquinone/menaquinone biosynthesis